jgi:glycogen synthase kinase 3 beta
MLDPEGKNTPYIVSRYYRAPELLMCETFYTTSIDIWATGCIMAELITKQPLFQGKTEGDQLFAIFRVMGSPNEEEWKEIKAKVPFDATLFQYFPKEKGANLNEMLARLGKDLPAFLDLLHRMLKVIPNQRFNASEAIKHHFFDQVRNVTEKEALKDITYQSQGNGSATFSSN